VPGKPDKKRSWKRKETYSSYIFKVLKQVHLQIGIQEAKSSGSEAKAQKLRSRTQEAKSCGSEA
jgi:hypothetical protein